MKFIQIGGLAGVFFLLILLLLLLVAIPVLLGIIIFLIIIAFLLAVPAMIIGLFKPRKHKEEQKNTKVLEAEYKMKEKK